MKIIGLKISGMRTLVAAEMQIKEKGLTPIKARNKAGKTTVLDALEILFEGNTHVEPDMITHGQEKMTIEGTVIGDNGERYVVKKVITPKSARLEITDEKGFSMSKKPQEFLNSLISDLSFNPRHFLELEGDKKLKDLMQLLKIDFTSIDSKIKMKEQERLLVGREVKNFGDVELGEEVLPVDIAEVIEKKKALSAANDKIKADHESECRQQQIKNQERNKAYEQEQAAIKTLQGAENVFTLHISDIDSQIERLMKEKAEKIAAREDVRTALHNRPQVEDPVDVFTFGMPFMKPLVDLAPLDSLIESASQTNARAMEYGIRKEKQRLKMEKESAYTKLTEEIETLRTDKLRILKEAPMPVPGLEIKPVPGEEEKYGLFYGDTYSENWSESEGLLIASQICLSQNPKLRAVFLDKGESMDSETLKKFAQWAEEHDMQAVITIVADVPEPEDMESNTWYIVAGELVTKEAESQEPQGELALD